MANVKLYTGTARSARTQTIDRIMREHWGHALLVVPTRTEARQRLEGLLLDGDLPGAWGTPVLTLEDLAAQILAGEGIRVHRIGTMERRMLVEDVVRRLADEGKLSELGDAATSPGFINHILSVITQLKQAATEPERFSEVAKKRRRGSWLDPIVAAVYEGYQEALIHARSYDRVGIYWRAELTARQARPSRLNGVDTVLLDGFEDFTPSEFRLLESLEPFVDHLILGIDGDLEQPSRQDLYDIPRDTQNKVRDVWPDVEIENLPTPRPTTLGEYLAHDIFWRQQPAPPNDLCANVEVVECPDFRQEIEYVGRRVKSLLVDGDAAPNQIAVVFRDVQSVATEVRSAFDAFGIPIWIDSPVTLEMTPLATFVLNLLEACGTWTRDAVLDVLTSPWFTAGGAPETQVDLFPTLARRAGIIEGRDEWTERLQAFLKRIRDHDNAEDSRFRMLPHMSEATLALLARVEVLKTVAHALPTRDPIHSHVARLDAGLNQCGCNGDTAAGMPPPIRERAESSWRALNTALGRIDAWYRRAEPPPSISREDFVAVLRGSFRETELALDARAGVTCRGVDTIRSVTYDHVFLCGMNEGEFPRPPSIGAIYSDDDVADFADNHVQLETKHRHASREMLAFHHALRAAKQRMVMTCHSQTQEGRAASPSPYLADALEMLNTLGVTTALPDTPTFAPLPALVANLRDLRNAAFARGAALFDLYRNEFKSAAATLAIEKTRQAPGAFDRYDGLLQDPGVSKLVADHFGAGHEFSVNQLEMYANCPFQFFMARILDASIAEEPDAGFDPLVRGSILHDALQAFHREFAGRPVSNIPESNAESAMARHLDEAFARRAYQSTNTPPKAAEVERMRMSAKLRRYLALARKAAEAAWAPSHFEVSFGSGRGTTEDSLSTPEPFLFATDMGPVRFSGRIDRIDRQGNDARIIDYKTSVYAQQPDIDAGVSIQLPLYAMALEEHLAPDTTCADARFIQIGSKKYLKGLSSKTVTWEERREKIREQIAAHVAGIREGRFPPTPYREMCRDCAAHRACRYESSRIERKEAGE